MRCTNCSIEVGREFIHAWSVNICPGCGKNIMLPEQMGSYLSLCELLKTIVPLELVDKVAVCIAANFELKQTFKVPVEAKPAYSIYTPPQSSCGSGGSYTQTSGPSEIEVKEAEQIMKETGIGFDVMDKNKSQAILQKMRDDALAGALDERYGDEVGNVEDVTGTTNPVVNAHAAEMFQKQANAQQTLLNGGKGFRRS